MNERVTPAVSTLALLAVAGFASLVSMRLCDAMVPALAAAFTTSSADSAIVVSSFALTYGLLQLVYGPLGDRYGKPRVIAYASAWCALATAAASFAPSLKLLVLARAAMGAGAAGIVPLALAWIGDTVPAAQRQVVLARFSGAILSGIVVGAWSGGFLTELLGWRAAFLAAAPLFAVVALTLGPRASAMARPSAAPTAPYHRRVAEILAAPWARTVLGTVFIEGLFGFGFLAFLPTVLHERFALPLSYAGGIVALFAAGGFAFSRLAPFLLKRLTSPVQARVGSAMMGIGYVMLAVMPHWSWAVIASPLAGFGFYTFHNTLQMHATQLSTSSRGMAVTIFACCLFLGQSAGVPIAALIFTSVHPAWGFVAAGIGLTVMGLRFSRQLQRREAHLASAPA